LSSFNLFKGKIRKERGTKKRKKKRKEKSDKW